jgi:hypothetical protein
LKAGLRGYVSLRAEAFVGIKTSVIVGSAVCKRAWFYRVYIPFAVATPASTAESYVEWLKELKYLVLNPAEYF